MKLGYFTLTDNPVAYGVDVTLDMFDELAGEPLVVAMKESTDDIRRVSEVISRFGDRFDIFTGVDNLALESLVMGATGWVAGLVVAFPKDHALVKGAASTAVTRLPLAPTPYPTPPPILGGGEIIFSGFYDSDGT